MAILTNTHPKYSRFQANEEAKRKLETSNNECYCLQERELKCPYCYFVMGGIFSDSGAHIRLKFPKCGAAMIINTAYFRRQRKNTYRGNYQRKYKR